MSCHVLTSHSSLLLGGLLGFLDGCLNDPSQLALLLVGIEALSPGLTLLLRQGPLH